MTMDRPVLDAGKTDSAPSPASPPNGVVIREMRDSDSFEELTALLHGAYREHLRQGRNYLAATQSVEMTRRRCEGGTTLLAFADGRLAGTATMRETRKGRCLCGSLSQVAVSPDCRKLGLGKRLLNQLETMAREKGYSCLLCDTAATARELVSWYLRQGWQKVSCKSHPSTNYYSIVFRKYLDGRPHRFVGLLFRLKSIQCHLLRRADGNLRCGLTPFMRFVRRVPRGAGKRPCQEKPGTEK